MSRHYAWFTERKQTGIIYKEKIKIYNCLNEFLKSLPKEKPEHFYFYSINLIDPTIGASENEIIEFEITSFNIADNLHAKIDYEELYYSDAPTWLKILYLKLSNAPCIKKLISQIVLESKNSPDELIEAVAKYLEFDTSDYDCYGDESDYETLDKAFLLLAHESPNVRAALLKNASLCEMGLDDYIAKILMRDKDPIVQDAITEYLVKNHG